MAISVRPYTLADFHDLVRIQSECFPPPFPSELWWSQEQIASHVALFPVGALCAIDGQTIVGSATCNRIQFELEHAGHNWSEAADNGYIRNYNPMGDTLYGIDIGVRPAWRGRGVARALYEARFELVRSLGLKRFLAGSRMSGYHKYIYMTPEQYAEEVVAGRIIDPVVTPQLKAGLRPLKVVREYLPDEEARNCALLMEWKP